MSQHQLRARLVTYRDRLPVSWLTIALFAAVISYVDGFWVTSVHGAVGVVGRNQHPFTTWLRDSTLMVPLFAVSIVAAVVLANRIVSERRRTALRFGVAVLLIVLATTIVSTAQVTGNSAWDYHIQAQQITTTHAIGHDHLILTQAGSVDLSTQPGCTGACAAKRDTLHVHIRAIGYASMLLLITNVIAIAWLLALRGGRLWDPRRSTTAVPVDEPTTPAPMSSAIT